MLHKLKSVLKHKRSGKKAVAITGILLVVFAAAYLVISLVFINSVNCNKITSTAKDLLEHNKYQQAYKELASHVSSCTENSGQSSKQFQAQSTTIKVKAVQYGIDTAKAAYSAGYKQGSFKYSNQTIQLIQSMTPAERQQIPNEQSDLMQLLIIKSNAIPVSYTIFQEEHKTQ